MKYREVELKTINVAGESWRVVWRDFEGVRVLHGDFVEWPVLVPITHHLSFAAYEFNGERSMPEPNKGVPVEVRGAVATILKRPKSWLPEAA